MGQLYYPKADRTSQRFDDDYAGIRWPSGQAEKGCIHTTETSNWPGYQGGATAPTITVKPDMLRMKCEWRQHFPANMSVRALQNDRGGVETNRDRVIQVEIVGTCDDTHDGLHDRWTRRGTPHLFTPEAPEWFLEEMADFFLWCYQEQGVRLDCVSTWLNYGPDLRAAGRNPASYGNSPVRMSGSTFNNFRGWLGHMHVAENDHGDPGRLNVPRIINIARQKLTPAKSEEGIPDMFICNYGTDYYIVGVTGKRKITKAAADELRSEARIPYVGNTIGAGTLNEFPTFDENNHTVGGNTAAMTTSTFNGVRELLSRVPTPTPEG